MSFNLTIHQNSPQYAHAVMYESVVFLLLMRIFLPTLNGLGALVALDASVAHASKLFLQRNTFVAERHRHTARIMLLGSVIQLVSCLIRMVALSFFRFVTGFDGAGNWSV